MKTDTSDAAQGQESSRPRLSFENVIFVTDSEEDANAVRDLGAEAMAFDHVCQELPECNFSKMLFVVSTYRAGERARELIDRGAPRMGVMFADLVEGHTLASKARQEGWRKFLMGLLEFPHDPLLDDYVRPALFWAREPVELIDCGYEEIGDGLRWSRPSIAVWAVDDRSSGAVMFFALKQMLTSEGIAQNLRTSVCAFEDDSTYCHAQLMAHIHANHREQMVGLVSDRMWRFDVTRPRPPSLDEWKEQVRVLATRYDVRLHIVDCLTANLPECIPDLRQFATNLSIAVHIVAHTPKWTDHGGKIKPIRMKDALGSGDFRRLSDYALCVVNSTYLAKLKRGKVREDDDIDYSDIAAANACTPHVEADSHTILAVEKASIGSPGIYAFAYDKALQDIVLDRGASMLVRRIWRV